VQLEIESLVTQFASQSAPDFYRLTFTESSNRLRRNEEFTFKRVSGRGRRITVDGTQVSIGGRRLRVASEQTTALATLPKLAPEQGGEGIDAFARFLSSIFVLEPDVTAARQPSRLLGSRLADDASNLSDALLRLHDLDQDVFRDLQRDMRRCLTGLERIEFQRAGGSSRNVVATLRERGINAPIELADASFGTVRLLALLAALHDPDPPPLTAIEEVDHGLHPYALDIVVERLREASERTQLVVATHSPTLVNRLTADELIVCGRDSRTGESIIPAIDATTLAEAAEAGDLGLGELWFSGVVGGVPAPT
jgi:predicted ATPase